MRYYDPTRAMTHILPTRTDVQQDGVEQLLRRKI